MLVREGRLCGCFRLDHSIVVCLPSGQHTDDTKMSCLHAHRALANDLETRVQDMLRHQESRMHPDSAPQLEQLHAEVMKWTWRRGRMWVCCIFI